MPLLYKSTDGGAPPLTLDKGNLNGILKAILVNGYGNNPAAGWTLEYEDAANDICIYRNSVANGTGGFLRVAFMTPGFSDVLVCEAATGTATANLINPTYSVKIRYDITGGSFPWAAVADDRSIYLKILAGDDKNENQVYFFGDFVSVIAGDLYNFAVAGTDNDRTPVGNYYGGNIYFLKDRLGGNFSVGANATNKNIGSSDFFGDVGSDVNYPYNGAIFRERPFFVEALTQPRGKLPGLTVFGHNGAEMMSDLGLAYRSASIDDVVKPVVIEGINYIPLPTRGGIVFIDTDNWRVL